MLTSGEARIDRILDCSTLPITDKSKSNRVCTVQAPSGATDIVVDKCIPNASMVIWIYNCKNKPCGIVFFVFGNILAERGYDYDRCDGWG